MRFAILFSLTALAATPWAATSADERFDGDASGRTPVFEQSGPWMLDWSTHSDNALPKIFELRLYDADSGEFLGTIVQQRETGSSRRMFEDPGRFQDSVVGAGGCQAGGPAGALPVWLGALLALVAVRRGRRRRRDAA